MKIVAFQPMDNYFINDHFPINYYFGCCCLVNAAVVVVTS